MKGSSLLSAMPLLVVLGCASSTPPPPVLVVGAPEAIGALAGAWRGEYWSADTGRSGVIRFELQASDEQAWGAVWMSPAHHGADELGTGATGPHGAQELEIRFVRALDEGVVMGTLEPYRDPECDCQLSTRFVGKLGGGAIEGTYTTEGPAGHRTTEGRWRVERETTAPHDDPAADGGQ
jgi:hypothetical protein